MHEIQRILVDNRNVKISNNLPLLCQYFDLIYGTSTGILISIMLGCLQMV